MQKASFVPYEGDEDYIFISYAHKDAAEVLPIMEKLHDEGYRIWYDDGIAPGSEWPEYIAEHLNACSVMLAMISEASIASANCRREVTYALSKSKTFLSVVLRETQMSPGMELQLSAQQSLLKYRYADEEDFYNKLLNSSVLFPCKRPAASALPETSAAAPSSRKPASAEDQAPDTPRINAEDMSAVKRMTNWEDAKANGASEPWKDDAAAPAAEEKKGAAPGRKKRSALIKVLIIVAAVFAAAFAYNAYSNYRQEQIAARNAENARIAAAAIPQEVFLGKLLTIYSSVSNLANAPTMTQTVGDTTLELVAMPLTTEVLGEDPEIMLLEFQDIYGEVYSFAARYTLSGGELTLTAPEEYVPVERETETSSEISLPDIEPIIPLTASSEETEPEAAVRGEGETALLTDSLIYGVSLSAGKIHLTYDTMYRDYLNEGVSDNTLILRGSACSDDDVYEGLLSVDFSAAEPEEGERVPCQLFFEGGGYSTDAYVENFFQTNVYIHMSNEVIPYNGRMQDNARTDTYSLTFINTYPYGFIIKDENDYYLYQDPVMNLGS